MQNPDIERWNQKYSSSADSAGLLNQALVPEGEAELVCLSHYLAGDGLALEVASGKGRNAMYLATLGYQVVAADCAINGLAQGQLAASMHNLTMASLVCDFETYRFPQNSFDLVSVIRFLHRPLFDAITSWIKPGGLLFYKTFNHEYLITHPRFNPDYVVQTGELDVAFQGFRILASDCLSREKDGEVKFQSTSGSSFILAQKK